VNIFRTGAAGDARRRAGELSTDQVDALLVAGGDGTISEVIDGMMNVGGPAPPLALLPVGTENLLGKVIGARASVGQVVATLARWRTRTFDVGRLDRPADRGDRWDTGAGPLPQLSHFMMVCGAGFDSEVVHRLAQSREGSITYADYFPPIVHTLMDYDFPTMRVEADGELVCDEPAMVFVGNIPRYAWGLPICKKADSTDGLLDLVVYRCANRRELVAHSVRTVLWDHVGHPRVTYQHVRDVVVRCERAISLQVDGDDCGQLPAEFAMAGEKVRLLCPPSAGGMSDGQ
jgi:YegS/Rv2252/BmrU family lipid kinase